MSVAIASSATGRGTTAEGAWIEIGRVARAHGLLGGLVVIALGDDPENLLAAELVRLAGAPGRVEFRVRRVAGVPGSRQRVPRVRLELEGLDSRESAEAWAGATVSIPESALPSLDEGEYYWRDLLGLECVTVDGRVLGRVEEIWPTGSNDVLVVRGPRGTVLIPALREVLVELDGEHGRLRVTLPAGLLESS